MSSFCLLIKIQESQKLVKSFFCVGKNGVELLAHGTVKSAFYQEWIDKLNSCSINLTENENLYTLLRTSLYLWVSSACRYLMKASLYYPENQGKALISIRILHFAYFFKWSLRIMVKNTTKRQSLTLVYKLALFSDNEIKVKTIFLKTEAIYYFIIYISNKSRHWRVNLTIFNYLVPRHGVFKQFNESIST